MDETLQRDAEDYGLVPRRVNFYAIYMPTKDDSEIQMMAGHSQGELEGNIMYIDFTKLKLKTLPERIEHLKLFELSQEFYEDNVGNKGMKYIKKENRLRQIWDYQIRVVRKTASLMGMIKDTHYYYEKIGKFRKVPETSNSFLFDLVILNNKANGGHSEPQSISVTRPLSHNAYFIISLIETGKAHLLNDFIIQYTEFYNDLRAYEIQTQQVDNYYEVMHNYLNKKYKNEISANIEVVLALASSFGLLPRLGRFILEPSLVPMKIFSIINAFEKCVEDFGKLEKDGVLYKTALEGLAFLLLIQQSKLRYTDLLTTAKRFSHDKKLFSDLIQRVLAQADQLDVYISPDTFNGLHKIMDKTLLQGANQLNFTNTYGEFVRVAKDLLIRSFQEVEENEKKKKEDAMNEEPAGNLEEEKKDEIDMEEPKPNLPRELKVNTKEGNQQSLPKKLSREQQEIFEKLKKDMNESLIKLMKKQPPYLITLEDLEEFLQGLHGIPEYFVEIFESNQRVCENISGILERRLITDVKELVIVHNIMVQCYNPFILHKIDRLKYIRDLICSYVVARNTDFYIRAFTLFMAASEVDLKTFESLVPRWLEKIPNIDRVIVQLENYSNSFSETDREVNKKREILGQKVIEQIRDFDLKEKIDVVYKNIQDKELLEMYKNRFIRDIIQQNIMHINSTGLNNPIIILQNLKKRYPQNKLIEDLIAYCLTQVPKPIKQEILTNLFEDPKRDSFFYMVLTDPIFKKTEVYDNINKMCLSIINQMQDFGLELKWINIIQSLTPRAKNVMEEQLKILVDQNNLTVKDSEKKLDVKKLIEEAEQAFKERLSMIDAIRDFISAYCLDASDAQNYVDELVRIRDRINEKKITDLEFPEKLKFFADYAKTLNPFIYSVSFEMFRKRERAALNQVLNCEEEAGFAEKLLEGFKQALKDLLSDENTTARHIDGFFKGVKDIRKEVGILSELFDKENTEYLLELLTCIREKETLKRISKGVKSCLKFFNLSCDFLPLVEAGCGLTTKSPARILYETSKAISEKFKLDQFKEGFKVLTEFEGADELLTFTFARTNKSEIDFMKEAVNDYDESHISTQAIFDFTNFWNYILELSGDTKGKSLRVFLQKIQELSKNPIYNEIIANFKTSKVNFYGIQNLYLELTHKEEAKRKQIFKIINESCVRFIKPHKKFDIELKCETRIADKVSTQIFRASDIFELRDRANLIVYSEQKKIDQKEDNSYKEEELEKFRGFCSLTEVISQIINTLNTLNFNGYPELETLEVTNQKTCVVGTDFICKQNSFESLHEFKEQLGGILEAWNNSVIEAYKYYYELTYLKGKDFWKVEKALAFPKEKKISKGLHLLHYIGKEPVHEKVRLNLQASPEKRLINLGEVLKGLPNLYKLKRENELDNFSFKIVEVSEVAIIKGLMTLYMTFEKMLPFSSQILVCHASTSWNELVAFAFRCFFDPNKRLFCLIQPERLSFSFQDEFSSLLKRLNNEYPHEKFQLAFVTLDLDTHLIRSFNIKGQTKILKSGELLSNDDLRKYINKYSKGCCAVTSAITGLGKTRWARNYVELQGLKYCKIPISGKISPIELGKRLHPVLLRDKPALCFTLGSVDKEDRSLLNEILFSLVVLRSFHFSRNVIEIPKEIQIIFEIDSSYFENLTADIEILGYLQSHDLKEMNFNELDYKSPKTQFVCHYIKGWLDRSLGTRDLTLEETQGVVLDLNECLRVLCPKFLENRDKKYASYTQLTIFINVLYSLFKSFSESGFFCYSILSQNANQNIRNEVFMQEETVINMRLNLIEGLILAADQFTSKSVENVRRNQNVSMQAQKGENAEEFLSKAVVSWENSRPFSVVFTSDKSPIFVYKSVADIPAAVVESVKHQTQAWTALGGQAEDFLVEYKDSSQVKLFERLASLTNLLHNRNVCLKCFRKYEKGYVDVCVFCQESLHLNNNSSKKFIEEVALESSKDYALTPDNFIKMLLIFTRVEQKIPVVIMGETGCGKTSLVRYLCSRILDDKFHIFSIHAGVNQEQIVEQMNSFVEEAEVLALDGIKLWIFFDEFNTTSSIGLIKEIICERTMLGVQLPDNMIFLGACNPWRLKTQQIIFDDSVGIKKDRLKESDNYNLLYTVYPLPETMIDYVWDYGHLDANAERKYVEAMFSSIDKTVEAQLKEAMVTLVCAAQQQFKKWEDVSSVSLRDVARYKILFKWFLNSKIRRDSLSHKRGRKKALKTLQSEAAVLALLHCYYLRIASKKRRADFLQGLEPQFTRLLGLKVKDVEELLHKEEDDFLDRMKLPEDIAKNQALKENVFALIVCIMTKIPIFICGKPGCSKSLAVQLVFNNLRGKNSQDEYFRELPELIPVSYQGSEYCTSESILGVFNRAEKYLNVNTQNKEILPVIVFDEIGLAELSANNPLKVLHNKLEIENIKVSFVGISNWRLDASKMNRALYLARPDPDEKDLVFTAEAICGNKINMDAKNSRIIQTLAKVYCHLRDRLKEKRKEDIFGLRDYYFLIKGFTLDLQVLEERKRDLLDYNIEMYTIIRKNLKKNFSGLGDEPEYLWKQFCLLMGEPEKELQIPEPSGRELILNNLSDRNGRYLMVITKSDCVAEYIEEMIRNRDPVREEDDYEIMEIEYEKTQVATEVKTLVGSYMPEDLNQQAYGFRVLSDIILYIEKGYTLMFKKIDRVYSSLYDLFNQSFSWSGDKKYCRVALGALYNPKCLVHKDFHCVIFISESEVEKADPPFLNRFEKYKLSIEDILTENERLLKDELEKWVLSITQPEGEVADAILPKLVFVNYDSEYLFSLILKAKGKIEAQGEFYHNKDERILELCKRELIQTASSDFPVVVSLNVKNEELKQGFIETYYELRKEKFRDYVDKIIQDDREGFQKNIVYTYTQISDDIVYSQKEAIKELKLGSFKSENEVIEEVAKFFNSENSLLVIRLDLSKESEHLLLIKHLLLNAISNIHQSKGHHLMIIVHLQRFNAGEAAVTTLFQDWQSRMFDDLNEEFTIPFEYMEKPNFLKLSELKILDPLESLIPELFDKCLSKIKYNVDAGLEKQVNVRRNDILAKLRDAKELWELFEDKIRSMILKDKMNMKFRDWRKYILQEEWVRAEATSTIEAINLALSKYYEGHLMKIVYNLENENLLDSYIERTLVELWKKKFNEMNVNIAKILSDQVVEVNFTFGLVFPFSTYEEVRIKDIQESVDETEKAQNPDLYNLIIFEKFVDSSFFGEEFYLNGIFAEKDLFQKFFNDQLILYLKRNKIAVPAEVADRILDIMFMHSTKSKFQYFLTNSKEFSLVLGVIEGLLTLRDGQNILVKCLNGFYNLEEEGVTLEEIKEKQDNPKFLLLFKEGAFYNQELEKDENDNPFISFLFQNIVDEISSCDYLAQFRQIGEIKKSFRLIEEKMIKTGIYPDNLEAFRPWICLMQFLEFSDKQPSEMFTKTVGFLKGFEDIGIFSVSKSINKLIDFLRANVSFVANLNKPERERKIVKLQTQLYKNLVNLYDDEYFEQVVEIIDRDEELWKNSAQIIDSLDHYTAFSDTVMECNGRLEDPEYTSGIPTLEKILSGSSRKIAFLLTNKAFVSLKAQWQERYQEVLEEDLEEFKKNLRYFEKLSKLAVKKDWNETPYTAFLMVIVWLKAYLFYYSQALEKDEKDLAVLKDIDITLCELSPELATLKLYVLKNLQLTKNRSLKDLRKEYMQRNVQWIKPLLKENPNKNQNADILAPLPLYQKEEYKEVENLLNEAYNFGGQVVQKFIELCKRSSKEYNTLKCIYAWFIKLYINHLQQQPKFVPDEEFMKTIQKEEKALKISLGDKGYELILLLLNNFTQESYFRLKPDMKNEDVYQRLAALDIVTTFLAQTFLPSSFGQIFFKNETLPKDFAAHLEQACLFGQLENNFIVANMKDVKMNIERRLRQNLIIADAHFIYKCGPNCNYLYYFEGCGRPIERSLCKICGSEIGAAAYNQLLIRNNGKGEQIRMPIPQGLKHIDEEIRKFEEKERKGYLFNPVNENAKVDSKQSIKPITFRTLHFILHAVIFSFAEMKFIEKGELDKLLKVNNENSLEYFKAHFFQDYKMVGELLGTQETHIWIYQLLAAFEGVVREKTQINTAVALNKLEKSFEDQVIFPVIQSVNTVIQKYKQGYVEYHKLADEGEDVGIFVEELQLDQAKYPWLEFFNYMKFPDFTDFSNQFALLIGDSKNFSLLDFVLKRHDELANITSLPTIVDFTNNLMKKFNYQISRDKASTTLMSSLFEEDEELKKKFKNFESSWNRIQKVQTVRVGCQEKPYKKISDQDTLSLLLPNNNKDESGLIVLGTMIYLAILQNEFIYTAKRANSPNKSLEEIITEEKINMEIMQTVQTDQVIHINKNLVMTDIIQSGYIHNFEYGKGREIIYDFEEIEGKLHQYTNGKKIIDESKFITMNYQFELYPTGASIITDIRKKNPQENLSQEAKAKYRNTIKQIARDSKKDLLAYLGSLDYVFTYLRNIKENGDQTVEDFCKEKIINYQHLNDYVIRRQPLSTVCLKYIVDLYETLEEVIFDEAIQDYIRPEFWEQIGEEEKTKIIEAFDKVTLKHPGNAVYPKLKEPNTLAKVFKRLILRILLAQVDINNRLLEYFAREDMWEQDVDINEIMDVELGEEVQLRHAYVILRHLEAQIVKLEPAREVKQQNQLLNHQMEVEMENEIGKPKINQKVNAGGEKGTHRVEAKNKKNRRV